MKQLIRILALTGLTISLMQGQEQSKDFWIPLIRDKNKTEEQKISEIKKLIKEGFNVNSKAQETIQAFTPLILAAELGYLNLARMLLENGALVNATDRDDMSAIYYAARKGHFDMVQFLLSRGAKVDGKNKQGNNILLDMLFRYPINIEEAKDKEQFKKNINRVAELLIERGVNVNEQRTPAMGGTTAVMLAATVNDWDLVRLLIRKKANLCIKDQFGNTLAYHLPDLTKEKDRKGLAAADIAYIKELRNTLEDCEWEIIKKHGIQQTP